MKEVDMVSRSFGSLSGFPINTLHEKAFFLSFISTVCLGQEVSLYAVAWCLLQRGFDLH